MSVLLGNGDGAFQPRTAFGTGGNPTSVAVGDFNGDGVIDLVSGNSTSGTVSVLLATAISSTTSLSVRPLADIDVATRGTALASQATIDTYLEEVGAVAGIIGAAASRFEVAATTLALSSENYRAAESQILDADIAEEAAHLARSRILQQAGAVVLAQANQAPALALSLLQV